MAKEDQHQQEGEELQLLSRSRSGSPDSDTVVFPATQPRHSFSIPRRQSSFAQPRPSGTPRTQNRVRFDVEDSVHSASVNGEAGAAAAAAGGGGQPARAGDGEQGGERGGDDPNDWIDEEDYMSTTNQSQRYGDGRYRAAQRAPLLTDVEAPTVTLAESDFNPEDLLESARPKSGMRSAFMNMANSIMYVV